MSGNTEFTAQLKRLFPGAVPDTAFVDWTCNALKPLGINPSNAISCISLCRDEACNGLRDKLEQKWGSSFNLQSLGGLVFCGPTGIGAAHHHAPEAEDKRNKYVYIALAHIGIGEKGETGVVLRPGQNKHSTACGALCALHGQCCAGKFDGALDDGDIEYSLMKRVLLRHTESKESKLEARGPEFQAATAAGSIMDLTLSAQRVVIAELEDLISKSVDPKESDYVVISGVQVHGPTQDHVWLSNPYACVKGEKHSLDLPTN